eukprot:gnl/MRDRNA2_/MRDRNA2_115204_c0_seq1.p1 gnl/MRDRNA2_/MRDRNA2_115204_c0~~gnl/MRDRNA2_/MRDRNA2_115204_c0_seq1.p1  ORF type:complete len:1174 (-),score=290.35 gnl/MRDRNA2_/MRDRNA2_115204_c0_seq1:3-3524(-)
MNSLSTTLDALSNDQIRGLTVSEQKLSNARGKLAISRNLNTETSLKHAKNRVDRFDDEPEEAEEKFLSKILWTVPLMQKSSRLFVSLRKCVFPETKEGQEATLDPAAVLSAQVTNLHKMKYCTARICWKEVLALTTKMETLQAAHDVLKETHRKMQRQYLKEISDDRDAKRQRGDPEAGLNTGSTDIIMFYEPLQFCEPEWQQAIFEIVKEKLKMIFDKNPGLESTVCTGQLTAMKALVESNQITQMKEIIKRLKDENTELKFRIADLERNFRKLKGGTQPEKNSEGVMAMDAELQKKCHEVLKLKKELAEAEKGRSTAQDRLKETAAILAERDALLHESEIKVHDLQTEIENLNADKAQLIHKLERAENHVKVAESDLKQLRQSVTRKRKLDKGENRIQEDVNVKPESLSQDESSSISKKPLSQRTNEPSVVKEALAAAQQSEEQLCQKIEENQELRDKVEVLIDESNDLRTDRVDLLQEMAAIQTDSVLEKVELVAKMSTDLDDVTKELEMEDDAGRPQDQLSVEELKGKLEETNVEIEHVVGSLQEVLAEKSSGVPDIKIKASKLQDRLVNLYRERTALKLRFAMAMKQPSSLRQAEDTHNARRARVNSDAEYVKEAIESVTEAIENPTNQIDLEQILGDQAMAYEKLANMLAKHFDWNKESCKFDKWPPDLEELLSKLEALAESIAESARDDPAVVDEKLANMLAKRFGWSKESYSFKTWPPTVEELISKLAALAEPALGVCSQCNVYQGEILGLKKALKETENDAMAKPARDGCPKCEMYQAEIRGLRQALTEYKKMTAETVENLRGSGDQVKALQETIEILQHKNKTLLATLMSIKGIQGNPEVQACIALLHDAQAISVFDRLWIDAERRKKTSDLAREERRKRMMQRNEHRWVLDSSEPAHTGNSFASKSRDPRLQRENVGSQKPSQQRSEVPPVASSAHAQTRGNRDVSARIVNVGFQNPSQQRSDVPPEFTYQEGHAKEVSVQDLPSERIGIDSRDPMPAVDVNYETQGHLGPQSSPHQKSPPMSSHNEASSVPAQEPANEMRCATPNLPQVPNSAPPSHQSSKPNEAHPPNRQLGDDKSQQQRLQKKDVKLKAKAPPQPKLPAPPTKLKPTKAAVRLMDNSGVGCIGGFGAVGALVGHSNVAGNAQRRTPESMAQAISPDRKR